MKTVTINKAKTELPRLIELAQAGEDIIILRRKQPVARLTPLRQTRRQFGALRGKASVDEAFFEPLPDEELAAWQQ